MGRTVPPRGPGIWCYGTQLLTRDRLGGGGIRTPTRFSLNNVRIVTDIDAKLGIPSRTSLLRRNTK